MKGKWASDNDKLTFLGAVTICTGTYLYDLIISPMCWRVYLIISILKNKNLREMS